jgi:hypothetical protein
MGDITTRLGLAIQDDYWEICQDAKREIERLRAELELSADAIARQIEVNQGLRQVVENLEDALGADQ